MKRHSLAVLTLVALTACSSPTSSEDAIPATEKSATTAATAAEPSEEAEPQPASAQPSSAQPSTSSPASSQAPTTKPASRGSCAAKAESLSASEQAGQLLMVGVSTEGLDASTARAIEASKAGSVVLLGNSNVSKARITELSAEITELGPDELPILISVDQEGGQIQRLRGDGFTRIPTAVEQGKLTEEELAAAAERWGSELREAGVHYDLAPTADVVPSDNVSRNAPIGQLQRHYGTDPAAVAGSVTAFVEGMTTAGVATSLKHFPGLGRVEHNTDFAAAVDDVTTTDDPFLESFKAGIDAGASSVMISSAVFTQIDADNEGVFSETIMQDMLRDELGFDGVVIADDLGAAKSVADVPPGDRAVRFLEAGGDLVINADPSIAQQMSIAVTERIETDPAFAQSAAESVARVLELKRSVDLGGC